MKKLFTYVFILLTPGFAFAEETYGVGYNNPNITPAMSSTGQGLLNLIHEVATIVSALIPILIAVAVIAFFWGLVKYIWGSGKGTTDGRKIMIAGIISIFIMVTLYGIIQFTANTLGVSTASGPLNPPTIGGIRTVNP